MGKNYENKSRKVDLRLVAREAKISRQVDLYHLEKPI